MGGLTLGYVVRRVGMFFLTVWLGATIIFIIPRLAPGDPVTAMIGRMMGQGAQVERSAEIIAAWRARFGLDEPMIVQYFKFLGNVARFDLGYSLSSFPSTVSDLVGQSLPWTIGLLMIATILSFIGGNTVGALMAWRKTPALVKQLLPLTLTFTSIPFFMLGILLLYVFAFGLGWFPVGGGYGRGIQQAWSWSFIRSVIYHGTLPAFAIVIASVGFWALGMRGMMITTDGEDYLTLATAKGLRPGRVFWRYAVRNAVLPQVTALALSIGTIASGAIVVEYLFSYPGMGYLLYLGIVNGDYTLIQGIVIITITTTAFAGLIIDLLYPILDPRITYAGR
jgi:peptide/nickel transport system permease protein